MFRVSGLGFGVSSSGVGFRGIRSRIEGLSLIHTYRILKKSINVYIYICTYFCVFLFLFIFLFIYLFTYL